MSAQFMTHAISAVWQSADIDDIALNIPEGLTLGTKILIAVFLFGVALSVKLSDFRDITRRPGVFAVALATQFVVIPAVSLGLIALLDVQASVALGLLLVVCLPAGNLSNLLTFRARGDVALSVSLTTLSSAGAVLITPIALAFWGSLSPQVADTLEEVDLSPLDVLIDVGLLIGLPFAAGVLVAHKFPDFSERTKKFVEPAVVTLLTLLIVGGLAGNASTALDYIKVVALAVIGQNLLSLGIGYAAASACRLPAAARRAMTLEMGIRNTALGLVLALTFFPEQGGVAVTVALWGLWDLITGFGLSTYWKRSADNDAHLAPTP